MKTMITTVVTFLGLFATSFAGAAEKIEYVDRVINIQNIPLTVALDASTVRCIKGDYGAPSLKISVPGLIGWTAFRQSTVGEKDPCINAGPCGPHGHNPAEVIDTSKPDEVINVNDELHELLVLDNVSKTCARTLLEKLSSEVRGLLFTHEESHDIGVLDYDICLQMKNK